MEERSIYKDIECRTGGNIYIGVVGPVRTGKSTFIKRFMDTLVLPHIDDEHLKERANDELPQSAAGRTIMTTEPKFVPENAVPITLDGNARLSVRMIDCVGYIVDSAVGYIEDDAERMVKTPWSEDEMPFRLPSGSWSRRTGRSAISRARIMSVRRNASQTSYRRPASPTSSCSTPCRPKAPRHPLWQRPCRKNTPLP